MTITLQQFMDKCPPIGCGKPYLVTCDGKDFAGANTEAEAEALRAAYQGNPKPGSPASKRNWSWRKR